MLMRGDPSTLTSPGIQAAPDDPIARFENEGGRLAVAQPRRSVAGSDAPSTVDRDPGGSLT
jgi:hypothetical protein